MYNNEISEFVKNAEERLENLKKEEQRLRLELDDIIHEQTALATLSEIYERKYLTFNIVKDGKTAISVSPKGIKIEGGGMSSETIDCIASDNTKTESITRELFSKTAKEVMSLLEKGALTETEIGRAMGWGTGKTNRIITKMRAVNMIYRDDKKWVIK